MDEYFMNDDYIWVRRSEFEAIVDKAERAHNDGLKMLDAATDTLLAVKPVLALLSAALPNDPLLRQAVAVLQATRRDMAALWRESPED